MSDVWSRAGHDMNGGRQIIEMKSNVGFLNGVEYFYGQHQMQISISDFRMWPFLLNVAIKIKIITHQKQGVSRFFSRLIHGTKKQ